MDTRKARVPHNFEPRSEVTLVGVVKKQGEVKAIRGGDFCEATVAVDDDEFGVWCRGKTALDMAAIHVGDAVQVTGSLSHKAWKVKDRGQRERVVVIADSVHPLVPTRTKDAG